MFEKISDYTALFLNMIFLLYKNFNVVVVMQIFLFYKLILFIQITFRISVRVYLLVVNTSFCQNRVTFRSRKCKLFINMQFVETNIFAVFSVWTYFL